MCTAKLKEWVLIMGFVIDIENAVTYILMVINLHELDFSHCQLMDETIRDYQI